MDIDLTPLDLKPVENNIYYEWLDLPNRIGGILIPDFHRVIMRKAVVRACGPTCEMVEPGDKILVTIFTGSHLFLCMETKLTDGERHRICREDEVLGLYADTPEEAKAIDERHKEERKRFLKKKQKELEG